jgi:phosphoenolpyruvate carboxylase
MPDALRRDVRLLGELLGIVLVESHGPDLLASVEELRHAVIAARDDPRRVASCDTLVLRWPPEFAELLARAFTCYFHLVNAAEEQHRQRTLRERARSGPLPESLATTIEELRAGGNATWISDHVARLAVNPVLTSHPTEARRPEIIRALRTVARVLDGLDDPRTSESERLRAREVLLEAIETLWRGSEVRETPLTVLDEVCAATAVLDETLFDVVPSMYAELDAALQPADVGRRPTLARAFVRFGSWAGGDRDGNPHVTPDATTAALRFQLDRGTAALQRSMTALIDLLRSEGTELSQRDALERIQARLRATRDTGGDRYRSPDEMLVDLRDLQRALAAAGAARFAYGRIQALIWQLETFGFTLAELELRQHSRVHVQALADVAHPLPSRMTREVLETFRTMRTLQDRHGVAACHRYVVSFTHAASDIAAVYELAERLPPDARPVLDVVPLFETMDDILRAPQILDEVIELPQVRSRIDDNSRRFEVMLGYSDSAKESGPVAATFALYDAQTALVAWASTHDIQLTLFHGRGGSLGRGGGPANRAILAQSPGSMSGGFKVTEQGEVVFARYGNAALARRHLEQVASAVLVAADPRTEERGRRAAQKWRALSERLATAARVAYRELVDAEAFTEWFARISPVDEVDGLHIGSRPARRGGREGFGELRAIPWVFAWAQTRLNLPGWYGLGSALMGEDLHALRDAYAEWPLFRVLIDNAEMSLAKTDREIALRHLELGQRPELGDRVMAEYDRTLEGVLAVLGAERLLATRPVLSWAVALRNPYVDALSHLQLRALRELRAGASGEDRSRSERLLILTMNGIAAGLQNTG